MSESVRLLRGRYELRSELGAGGMGVVWRAFDRDLEREVAIKQIRIGSNENLVRRTIREARITARINHPNIVRIYDFFVEDGQYFSVMELIEGSSLDQLISRKELTPLAIRRVLSEIAIALSVAHRHEIAHRDIKPQNIIVDVDGHAHLVDFGISRTLEQSRLTQSGAVIGTLAYMPPEVLSTQTATFASDVWALGATIYCCFEGRPPFGTGQGGLNTKALAEGTAPAPRHAEDLTDLLESMLAKDPDRRPTAPEVAQFLEHGAAATLPGRSVPTLPPPTAPSLPATPTATGPPVGPDGWHRQATPPPQPTPTPERAWTPPPGPIRQNTPTPPAGPQDSGPAWPNAWPQQPTPPPAPRPTPTPIPPPAGGARRDQPPPPVVDPRLTSTRWPDHEPGARTARRRTRRRLIAIGVVAVVAAAGTTFLLTRPSTGLAGGGVAASSTGSPSAAGAAPVGDGSDWCDVIKQNWPGTSGTSVSVYTTIVGDQPLYERSLKPFEECTGADVVWDGSEQMAEQINDRISGGNPPDTAIFGQPALLADIVESSGAVLEVPEATDASVDRWFGPGARSYGTVNDVYFGVPINTSVKSMVWYSPEKFKAAGYEVPTTYDDLIALSDRIAAAGSKPWCAGAESGDTTGWPLTDWLEDYVLRTAGPDVYDQWIAGTVNFSDPPIADALADMGQVIKNPAYANGGFGDVPTIATTSFRKAGLPILTGECFLQRQAASYEVTWPAGTTVGPDAQVNAFHFPGIDPAFGEPVLITSSTLAVLKDTPAAWALQYYFSTPAYSNERAQQGAWISANKGLQASSVPSPIFRTALRALTAPDAVVRYDATDLMPPPVSFEVAFQQLIAWIKGQDDATTLANIDAAWPDR